MYRSTELSLSTTLSGLVYHVYTVVPLVSCHVCTTVCYHCYISTYCLYDVRTYPVPDRSLHKRTFLCASSTLDVRNVVRGMLQLRRFHFLSGASMSLTVFNPVLFGCSDERWILLVELDCFGDFFLLCFVSLVLVRAWVVSDWIDG